MSESLTEHDDELRAACLELARASMWAQRPIDADEITTLSDRFVTAAKDMVSEALCIDIALLERAVRYITQAHGMPMGDNTDWFEYMLQALIEVARPNSGLDADGQAFLRDMMDGIKQSIEEE